MNDMPYSLKKGSETHTQSLYESTEQFQDHLLEQYKLYVEMIDRFTARRQQMNSFYISLLSGLLAATTLVFNSDVITLLNASFQKSALLALSLLGICLCSVWFLNLRSYSQLNSAKFKVLNKLEKQLPFACYASEWELIKSDNKYSKYITQTVIERIIPFVLIVPFVVLLKFSIFG